MNDSTLRGQRNLFDFEQRLSDSPFVETVWRTRPAGAGAFLSLAASNWEIVVTRFRGETTLTVRGPETVATPAFCRWTDAEYFGIIFKLGAFMPQLPPGRVLDRRDATLSSASKHSFWLHGAAWQYPDFENADSFVDRLVREGLLVHEPVVGAALHGRLDSFSPRTRQRLFLRATGLTQSTILQIERARFAALLLQQGRSILDTVVEVGYFDQAHLTRSLSRYIGQTPARIMDRTRQAPMSLLYKTASPIGVYAGRAEYERNGGGTR